MVGIIILLFSERLLKSIIGPWKHQDHKKYYKKANGVWNKEVKKKVPPIAGNFLYHIAASKLICSVIN